MTGSEKDTIRRDTIFRLLFLNMALVITGYALGVLTGMASVAPMRVLKYTVLGLSILMVLKQKAPLLQLVWHQMQSSQVLLAIFFLFALFTEEPAASLARTLTYLVPFMYVAISVGYLLLTYSFKTVVNEFLNMLNWVYFLPIISFFITGGSLTDTNIYYISAEGEGTAFVSNHYGWSGTLFLISGVDLLRNQSLRWWRRAMIFVFSGISLYLILISGNRTSWLCLLCVSLVFLFRYQNIALYQKLLITLLPLGLVFYLLQDPTSALNTRIQKTEVQAKKGEARVKVASSMTHYFNQNPANWVTGIGIFNRSKTGAILGGRGYHNSYFEILFGAGIVVFGYFFYMFVYRPLYIYLRYFSRQYLFFLPLIIIPYFESNLTGGQFLFFPWFISVILFSYCRKFAVLKEQIRKLASSDMQEPHSYEHS